MNISCTDDESQPERHGLDVVDDSIKILSLLAVVKEYLQLI